MVVVVVVVLAAEVVGAVEVVAGADDVAAVVVVLVEVAGVEEAAVVVVLIEVDVVGAAEVVVDVVDIAGVVALVVVTAVDALVVADVAVLLLPFPPHPIRSIATITRVIEIPNTFFKFHPFPSVLDFPLEVGGTRSQDILTPLRIKLPIEAKDNLCIR